MIGHQTIYKYNRQLIYVQKHCYLMRAAACSTELRDISQDRSYCYSSLMNKMLKNI